MHRDDYRGGRFYYAKIGESASLPQIQVQLKRVKLKVLDSYSVQMFSGFIITCCDQNEQFIHRTLDLQE